ncbi:MAG: 4-hydroxythreonine-4-phosphate dehydrogenase PdxA [Bacteroidia bacterium]
MAETNRIPVIGISIGDYNGIGLEVILKSLRDPRMTQFCTPVIYGSSKLVHFHRKRLNIRGVNLHTIEDISQVQERKLNLLTCLQDDSFVEFGNPTEHSGQFAYYSLKTVTAHAKEGNVDAIVTAPIQKKNIQSADFEFPGHTEFLASEFGATNALMFLVTPEMKMGVVTGHIPLKEVVQNITQENILTKLGLMDRSLQVDFGIPRPKIAVLGLNPHAGEEGLLGSEEKEIMQPAIESARENGLLAMGPYPADGFFASRMQCEFDAVLAMYHDQGLIPFKALAFERGVNFTAGLRVVRTSPDHGTGFAIAGKGVADESSFREAIYTAVDILKKRNDYEDLQQNRLKPRRQREKEK